MLNKKFKLRLEALFADIDRLAADPTCALPEVRRDIEALRARLCELEAEYLKSEKRDWQ